MDRSQYNTKEGIAAVIASQGLAGLRTIMEARRAAMEVLWARERGGAGPGRDELLTGFVVLGRFYLDSNGGASRVNREIVTDADRASAPHVMTMDEYQVWWAPITARNADDDRHSGPFDGHSGSDSRLQIPPAHVVCAKCGQGWTLEACHEIEGEEDRSQPEGRMSLAPYFGKTLREVQADIATRTDGEHRLNLSVYNDRWVDHGVPEEMRVGPQAGWRHDDEDDDPRITWDYVVQPGDDGSVSIDCFYHAACHREHEADQQTTEREFNRAGIEAMFTESGFTGVRVEIAPVPQHLVDWIASDSDAKDEEEGFAQSVAAESQYLRVVTDQGTVGIWTAVYPMLDLHGTGIRPTELCPEGIPGPMPTDDSLPFVNFYPDPALLLRLWQQLVKKQQAQPPIAPPAPPAP